MSEYDCVGVTSEYLNSLKNKIAELEQQNKEMKEFIKFIYEEGHIDDRLNNQCKIFIKDIT